MKHALAFGLAAIALGSLSAQAQDAKPGNCAIWLEETSKIVAADARFEGQTKTDMVSALDTFAATQKAVMEAGMEQSYKDAAAFGWDKAKVDEMIAQNDAQMRKGFVGPTMEPNKLYMDHLMKVNACVQANPNDSAYGMSRADFISKVEKAVPIVRGG